MYFEVPFVLKRIAIGTPGHIIYWWYVRCLISPETMKYGVSSVKRSSDHIGAAMMECFNAARKQIDAHPKFIRFVRISALDQKSYDEEVESE